jgi:hypothetical protein
MNLMSRKWRKELELPTTFVLTRGVEEFRATIPYYINKSDIVLEVGCAWGTTSQLLYENAKMVVAIDKGESLPIARETYPHIRFEQIDGFDIRAILKLGYKFNKIYVDISGSREILTVVKIATVYSTALKPEVIVIKSTKLKGFARGLVVWEGGKSVHTPRHKGSAGIEQQIEAHADDGALHQDVAAEPDAE